MLGTIGVERAMFASNFPVDKPMGGYDGIWKSFDAITAAFFSEDERRKLFHDNARCYYRL